MLEVGIFNKYIKYTYSGGLPLTSDYFSEILLEELNESSTKVIWKASFKRLHYWTKKPPKGQEDHVLIEQTLKCLSGWFKPIKKLYRKKW